jgi:2,4-dienoyl-CoA reductase-like NADH-dependent reductase (Old Yellow Enzyme family)
MTNSFVRPIAIAVGQMSRDEIQAAIDAFAYAAEFAAETGDTLTY